MVVSAIHHNIHLRVNCYICSLVHHFYYAFIVHTVHDGGDSDVFTTKLSGARR